MIVVKPVAHVDVEPGIARDREFFQPRRARLAELLQRSENLVRGDAVAELIVHAQVDRALCKPPEFIIWTKNLRFDSRHHPRNRLIADLRKRLLAEIEERQIGAISQEEKLEVVVPHPEIAL